MANFGDYLTAYERAIGLKSDSELAAKMQVTRQFVSKLRNHGKASDELCIEISQLIGVELGLVMLARNADRHGGVIGDAWKSLLGKVAAVVLLIGGSSTFSGDFDLRPQGQPCLRNDTQVIDSANKDYRKFGILFLRHALGAFLRFSLPVIGLPGRSLRTHCTAF